MTTLNTDYNNIVRMCLKVVARVSIPYCRKQSTVNHVRHTKGPRRTHFSVENSHTIFLQMVTLVFGEINYAACTTKLRVLSVIR